VDRLALFPIERRNLVTRQHLVDRVRAEFIEMPGLSLTLPQARRLFGLPQEACARILGGLAREGLLRYRPDGSYARRDQRP
jgi:hypothetical protein